jgi:hypothetical protein
MAKRLFHFLYAASLAAASASGADVSGAVSGFVYDSAARAIRPVLGIPGAAVLGEPLDSGSVVAYASIAPEQDVAVAVGTDGSVRLVRLGTRASQPLETLHGAPRSVAFSPRGSSAAFLNDSTLDVFTGFPEKPSLARTLDLAAVGTPSAVAISDDGTAVLVSAGGAVRAAGESADWKTLQEGEWVFAFVPGSRDALLAGRAGAVMLVREATASGERKQVAPGSDDAPAATAVAVTASGLYLVVQDRQVSVLDPSGQVLAKHACDCAPAGVSRMGSTFRLNEVSEAPLWLLDGASPEGRLVFVPPVARAGIPENN